MQYYCIVYQRIKNSWVYIAYLIFLVRISLFLYGGNSMQNIHVWATGNLLISKDLIIVIFLFPGQIYPNYPFKGNFFCAVMK